MSSGKCRPFCLGRNVLSLEVPVLSVHVLRTWSTKYLHGLVFKGTRVSADSILTEKVNKFTWLSIFQYELYETYEVIQVFE